MEEFKPCIQWLKASSKHSRWNQPLKINSRDTLYFQLCFRAPERPQQTGKMQLILFFYQGGGGLRLGNRNCFSHLNFSTQKKSMFDGFWGKVCISMLQKSIWLIFTAWTWTAWRVGNVSSGKDIISLTFKECVMSHAAAAFWTFSYSNSFHIDLRQLLQKIWHLLF